MYNETEIYCNKNKINGKLYIGQALNFKRRYLNFLNINHRYAGQVIENARKKYGVDNFEYSILTHCPVDELNYWESFYVERLNTTTPHGYNMTSGGDTVYTSTKEFKEKQTKKLKDFILSKNPNLDVSKVYYEGSVNNVTIICPIHGEFKRTPNIIFDKQTHDLLCPHCLRESVRQKTENNFFKKAREKWGNYYDYSKTVIHHHLSKITVICPIHGEFEVLAHNHISNKKNAGGCPKCSEIRMHDHLMKENGEKLINFIKNKWGDLYSFDKFVYKGDKEKITLICPKHGEFSVRPQNLKHSYGCPKCAVETIYSRKYNLPTNNECFIKRSKKIHGDKYDYSKVEYINSHTKVCIICPEHGEFWMVPPKHLNGSGCPKCNNTKVNIEPNITNTNIFIEKAKEVHGDKYDYSKIEYTYQHQKICIICPEHGEFWQLAYNHLHGYGCPKCGQKYQKKRKIVMQYSLNDELIREWLSLDEIIVNGITNNSSHIISCCTGKRNTAYGFKWKYKEDSPVKLPILQLTKDNVLVKEWDDISDIHKAKPITSTQHITKCLQGKFKTAGGFVWKYKKS